MLVDSAVAHFSGLNNWEVFKGQIERNETVTKNLAEIAAAARDMRTALVEQRYADVPAIMTREMAARKRLAPGVSSPEIEKIAEAAASEGGAAKVCGAGGGGMVLVWAVPGTKEKVAAAIRAAGFKIIAFRVDLRGLEVD